MEASDGLVYAHLLGGRQHHEYDSWVDIDNGQVLEFCDARVQQIKETVEKELGVSISHHSLTFYGHSSK